jgi:hypothetical protein
MNRYLVKRDAKLVFIWTALLAREPDLEEVFADNAAEALARETIPDPRQLSLDQLERMKKSDLVMFAEVKLQLKLPLDMSMAEMRERIKEAIFTSPPTPAPKKEPVANASANAH